MPRTLLSINLFILCMQCTTTPTPQIKSSAEIVPLPITTEEREYLKNNINMLGTPGSENDIIEQWKRVIDITARANDLQSAKIITNKANHDLDASYTSHYTYHLFHLFSKNPRLFFAAAIESFKSVEAIASFFVTEAGIVTSEDIAAAIDSAPAAFQDKHNSTLLLNLSRSIEKSSL